MAPADKKVALESLFEESNRSSEDDAELLFDLIQSLEESPLSSWSLIYEIQDRLKPDDLDAASVSKISQSVLPTLELFRNPQSIDSEKRQEVLLGMYFFVTELMAPASLREDPDIAFDCLDELYKRSPRDAPFINLVGAFQNLLVDHFVAMPAVKAPSQNEKTVNLWFEGVVYALEVSRFDLNSQQVVTLSRSIGETFFGGAKLNSALKRLDDFTGKIDETRSDFPYLFDVEVAKLVQRFSSERGALTGYSFLWALLEAFLLRMKNEHDYVSVLMLLVHLLQALGTPIKCMATPSLLEYPQLSLDENERLFHLMKLLEIYIESELYHPSVLVGGKKRFKGNLIFNDIVVYILEHDAKRTTNWYKALICLATISATIVTPKLRRTLQVSWFDGAPRDAEAQDEFLVFMIDLYDRMHKAADFYTRFLGGINDYLTKQNDEPRLSEKVVKRMRTSFANLKSDDVITIWTNYVRYLLQVLTKWSENDDELSDMPQMFTVKIFAEFIQHAPLVPQIQLTELEIQKMDSAIDQTETLTAKLKEVIDARAAKSKQLVPYFLKISQIFIKSRFARACYVRNAFSEGFHDAVLRQSVLTESLEENRKALRRDKKMKFDLMGDAIKYSTNPEEKADPCLGEICANFDSTDWQSFVFRHPYVLRTASTSQVEVFIGLIYNFVSEHVECTDDCRYVRSQTFRDSPRQVLSFAKLISRDLVIGLVKFDRRFKSIFSKNELESAVKWSELTTLLESMNEKNESFEIIVKANALLAFIPCHSLPPLARLKFLGVLLAYAAIEAEPTEDFFVACFHFLTDFSSALKFEDEQDDAVLISVCRLATLCLQRVLSVHPALSSHRESVKKTINLIRNTLYFTAKKAGSVALFAAILTDMPLTNDANVFSTLLLAETVTHVHSRSISNDEIDEVKSRCRKTLTKSFKHSVFERENVIVLTDKYADVFGYEQASKLRRFADAIKSARKSVLSLQAEVPALQLCLRAPVSENVIYMKYLVCCTLLSGREYSDVMIKAMNTELAEKIWPIVETVLDNNGRLSSVADEPGGEGEENDQEPFIFSSGSDRLPSNKIIFDRCLELTSSLVKFLDNAALANLVTKVHRFVAVRSFSPEFRLDLCCLILDAISRQHVCPEIFIPLYSALGSIPAESLSAASVDQWCIIVGTVMELYRRALIYKPNYTNGNAQIILGATARVIEAVVKRCDCSNKIDGIAELAKIINVIEKINEVFGVLLREKAKDSTRSLEACGPLLVASYLRSTLDISVHEKLRITLKSMAFQTLALCTSKGLSTLKYECSNAQLEALRRLVEEYKLQFQHYDKHF